MELALGVIIALAVLVLVVGLVFPRTRTVTGILLILAGVALSLTTVGALVGVPVALAGAGVLWFAWAARAARHRRR